MTEYSHVCYCCDLIFVVIIILCMFNNIFRKCIEYVQHMFARQTIGSAVGNYWVIEVTVDYTSNPFSRFQ